MNTPQLHSPFSSAKVTTENTDPEVYHTSKIQRGEIDFPLGRGQLMEFARCPMRWRNGYKSPDSESKTWGSMVDSAFLTPEMYAKRYVPQPETYPAPKNHAKVKSGELREGDPLPWNNNASVCSDWCEGQIGKTIIKHKEHNDVAAAIAKLHCDAQIHALWECSKKQVMVVGKYEDEQTGIEVPVKALIDLLPSNNHPFFGKTIADLKTTTSGAVYPFSKAVFNFNWHIQAAFYLDLYTAATGEDRTDWLIVLQESFEPWQTGKRILSMEYVELGRMAYQMALRRYCECLKTGVWPDYDCGDRTVQGWTLAEPEAWMMNP